MREEQEDNIQFRMRPDTDIDDAVISSQVDELRIEKLSHRMTLITILIPVLIVVILGVAYLDIKRRVVRTEDSGQLTAQTLSEDLQSRFSSLSVNQALIEENYARLKDQTEQSIAKVQVNLKKLDDALQQSSKSMASRSDVKNTAAKLENRLKTIGQSIDALNRQFQTLDQSIQQKWGQIDEQLASAAQQMQGLQQGLAQLKSSTIDKAAVDLAVKLEALKLKQTFKARMDETESTIDKDQAKIKSLEQQIAKLKAEWRKRTSNPPSAPPVPVPAPSEPGVLKEQTIQ